MGKRTFAAALVALTILLWLSQPAAAGVVEGSVLNVDLFNSRLRVLQPGGTVFVFTVARNTVVKQNGELYPFDLLLIGWRVRVEFNDKAGVVTRVDVFSN